jgi:hypothetical protein
MGFIARLKTLAQQETPAERRQRMVPGAMYGLIIASSYGLVGSMVNQLSFPDLPVGVDWHRLFITWLFLAVWLGLGGGFINWFTQTDESMATGLLAMTVSALGAGALTLEGDLPAQFGKVILLVLPMLAVSLLMTITLRWLGVSHAEIIEKARAQKINRIGGLVAIALAIGGITGFWLNLWTDTTQRGVRDIHGRLRTITVDAAQATALFPLSDMPGLEAHFGTPYTLHGRPSGQSVVATEVNVDFNDGYQITCVLLIFPDKPPFLRACAEGEEVTLPGN